MSRIDKPCFHGCTKSQLKWDIIMGHQGTHVVLPDALVAEIDALVGQRKRSALLAEVATREVRRRRLLEFLERKTPAWKPADHREIEAAGGRRLG